MNESYPISFTKKNEYVSSDYRFIDVTIDVLHTGVNLKRTAFSKEVVEAALPTIYNTPILGYVVNEDDYDEKDFKGHESEIKIKNGEVRYVYAGNAYGVIPESCNPRWVLRDDGTGQEREYLRVDGLIWTKFNDPVDIFSKDKIKNQSMEISDIKYEVDNEGIYHAKSFKFDGCCLLSTTNPRIIPAMTGSCAVANFSIEDVSNEIKQRLSEYAAIKNESENSESKGESNDMENNKSKNPDMSTDNPVTETLVENNNFSIENPESSEQENNNEGAQEPSEFTMSARDIMDEATRVLADYTYPAPWDKDEQIRMYWAIDIVDGEIIVNKRDDETIYGIPYTINGNSVELDMENMKRKKTTYVDWQDGDTQPENQMVAELEKLLSDKIVEADELKAACEREKKKYDEIKPQFDEYVAKEKQAQEDAVKAKRESLFAIMDEKLGDDENYTALKNNNELSFNDLETQCYALLGRKNAEFSYIVNSNKNKGAVKFGLGGSQKQDAAYGGIVERYRKN